uniref:Uncharacterized protein n=1 Tax=Tanacetum cinerariifolium TaxID=118510 RepID=A0A699ILB5_TANCI|nr:hypothetical protein [Tanacetum cinerariifolium]
MLQLLERATLSWIFKRRKISRMKTGLQWMQNTNFFRAFTASTSVLAIYLQQFWDTFMFKAKTGTYHFQLDEDWFTLDANLLREALDITPIDQAHQFVSPLLGDAIINFMNELGYPREIHFVSRMVVNNLYQPGRAILSMINQCLTGKTYGFDRPRYIVLQMLWGRNHKIHQRSGSPLNLAEDDLSLVNPKFVTKGEIDEVFGMQIPNKLIRNAPYYNAYMEMVAKHNQKMLGKKCSKVFPLLDADQKQEIRRFKEFLKRES